MIRLSDWRVGCSSVDDLGSVSLKGLRPSSSGAETEGGNSGKQGSERVGGGTACLGHSGKSQPRPGMTRSLFCRLPLMNNTTGVDRRAS